ncbi:hypothetical protein MCAP1_002388 [Malassezia caprae]|uniref:Uncharacterized protein n=1 Tax=Malassezia caprae TaxID=1381934 RepID=A0AAF0E899_9BASI|nr:hypothetical protein MCAP1_002388 [Malassezia caprae]
MTVGSKRSVEASPPPGPALEPRDAREEEWQIRKATEASLAVFPCPVCQQSFAQADIDRHVNSGSRTGRVPFYKLLEGMPISVDAFRYGAIEGATHQIASFAHAALQKPVDIVYLDTTYLHPRYNFPAQAQVVQACAAMLTNPSPRMTLSDFWHGRSEPEPAGQLVLVELDDPELHSMLTRSPQEARVHVVSLHWITHESVATLDVSALDDSNTNAFSEYRRVDAGESAS